MHISNGQLSLQLAMNINLIKSSVAFLYGTYKFDNRNKGFCMLKQRHSFNFSNNETRALLIYVYLATWQINEKLK